MDERPDADVVVAVLAGDREAYAVIVERYRDRYARFATRMLGNRQDAEEALQDAFVRAYRALDRCEDPAAFGAWFHAIVVNRCRTAGARRGREEKRFDLGDEALRNVAASDSWDGAAVLDEIERALMKLDAEHREAFLLKHVEEMSYEEMAEVTGAGVSALKMRVKRACERLRPLLEGVA